MKKRMNKDIGGIGFGGVPGPNYYEEELLKKQRVKRLKNEEDYH